MIKATKLQEEYRRHLNRRNSSYAKSISIADGDAYINSAIDIIFENLIIKFEITDLIRNHLRKLQVSEILYPEKISENTSRASFPEDYYKLLRAQARVCKEDCNLEKTIGLTTVQTADINKSLKDPYWKPSWEWERILSKELGDYLMVYHDCDFTPKELYIEYIKFPRHIATPSLTEKGQYISSDQKLVDRDIDFEIDNTFLWRKIAHLAAIQTLLDLGDVQDYQAQLQEILTFDKIFLT